MPTEEMWNTPGTYKSVPLNFSLQQTEYVTERIRILAQDMMRK